MLSKYKFHLITSFLIVFGVFLILHQKFALQIPFNPELKKDVWTVEAKIEYIPENNKDTEIFLCLPATQNGFTQLNQTSLSIGFGINYLEKNSSKFIHWTKKQPQNKQVLYYRAEILKDDSSDSSMLVPSIAMNTEAEPFKAAMKEVVNIVSPKSASPFSFAYQTIYELNQENEISSFLNKKYNRAELVVHILNLGNVCSKVIHVLNLENDSHHQSLKSYVAVFDKNEYIIFDPFTGISGLEENQLIWNDNENPIIDIFGGHIVSICFSTIKNSISAIKASEKLNGQKVISGNQTFSFSLDSLPVETQHLIKNMLLLPIGVLVALLLRVLVGIKSFGTFMPVLISITFLQTSLFFGVIGFLVIVSVGLLVRLFFSHFNLLLIGRISATLISVILIINLTSFVSFKIGIQQGIYVTMFPIIVLSWTIERISVLWEEEGFKEVLNQTIGSLVISLAAYFPMGSSLVQYLTFNFIGIQFILLGIVLLAGNYTGYKLTELKRFRPLAIQVKTLKNGDETIHESVRLTEEYEKLKSDPENTYKKWEKEIMKRMSKSEAEKNSDKDL